jgi:hypothetical protein
MEVWVTRKNIERLRAQLAAASNEDERKLLSDLLAQEEANLERLTRAAKTSKPKSE